MVCGRIGEADVHRRQLLTHRAARWIDDRLGAANLGRTALNKVFPDHWSFMIGELAEQHPEIVRAAGAAGHAIANHSWSHLSFPLLSARERYEQLRRCQEALAPYGQRLFRPPYCHQTLGSRWQALCAGYEVIGVFDEKKSAFSKCVVAAAKVIAAT